MKTNLMRTAYNTIIYEALDFTVGLFTPQGETVSIGTRPADVHPRHGGDGQGQVRHFGIEGISPATSCSPTTPT